MWFQNTALSGFRAVPFDERRRIISVIKDKSDIEDEVINTKALGRLQNWNNTVGFPDTLVTLLAPFQDFHVFCGSIKLSW